MHTSRFSNTNIIVIRMLLILISFSVSAYIAIKDLSNGYEYLLLLPLVYGVCMIIFPRMLKLTFNHLGMLIYNVVMFVRFVISPMTRAVSGFYGTVIGIIPTSEGVHIAIMLMVYEVIIISFVIHFFSRKFYKDTKRYDRDEELSVSFKAFNSKLTLIIVVGLAAVIVLIFPQIIDRYNFIMINNTITKMELDIPLDGLLYLIVDTSLILFSLLIVNKLKKLYDKRQSIIFVILSIVSVIPNFLIFRHTSRWSIIVPSIFWIVALRKFYPRNKKLITVVLITPLVAALVNITLYKRFGALTGGTINTNLDYSFLSNEMDIYFSGPMTLARAVDLKLFYGGTINITTFINDIFANLAVLSGFIDQNNTLAVIYNNFIYQRIGWVDQIIPFVGQGFVYFGYIGAPIFSVVSLCLMMFLDNKCATEVRPEFAYIYYYCTIWASLSMMLNGYIIFPTIINTFVPLYLMFKVNRKISLRKVKF